MLFHIKSFNLIMRLYPNRYGNTFFAYLYFHCMAVVHVEKSPHTIKVKLRNRFTG